MSHFRIAAVQICSSDQVQENIQSAGHLIRLASRENPSLIATPEMTSLIDRKRGALLTKAKAENDDEALASFRALASELSVWLLIGSLPIRVSPEKCVNRSYLISPQGKITARYDKIHLFDADLGAGETYCESNDYIPGDKAVLADIPNACLGLTLCYDVRFPHLYRTLAKAGAQILMVPAAFTRMTGSAHWHSLLRARAIETGCFVVAPAQSGIHIGGASAAGGCETFGHTLIVGPWGQVIAEAGIDPGVTHATLDLSQVLEARRKIPSLKHDREFVLSKEKG